MFSLNPEACRNAVMGGDPISLCSCTGGACRPMLMLLEAGIVNPIGIKITLEESGCAALEEGRLDNGITAIEVSPSHLSNGRWVPRLIRLTEIGTLPTE